MLCLEMPALETDRLKIIPLTAKLLGLYALNDGSLEKQLGVGYSPKEVGSNLAEGLEFHFLPLVAKHAEEFYFYTLWSIVLKTENVLVGDICFKGPPDEEGQIEIGYGTYEVYQQKGIMAEAVGVLMTWCQARADIKIVLAETDFGNVASEKILRKNGFLCYHQGRDNSWWKLDVRGK